MGLTDIQMVEHRSGVRRRLMLTIHFHGLRRLRGLETSRGESNAAIAFGEMSKLKVPACRFATEFMKPDDRVSLSFGFEPEL